MKKLSALFLFSILCLGASAQTIKVKKKMPKKLNAVKLNLSSLLVNNIGIQYERALSPKIAVACQARYTMPGKLALSNAYGSIVNGDSILDGEIKLGGWAITPEFRFYPKHVLKGFYLAPYVRVRNISLDYPVSYKDDLGRQQSVLASGNINSFGGGLMIGSHFNLGKSVSLDWFILGLQFMSSKASFKATSSESLSPSEQSDLRAELDKIRTDADFLIKTFDYQVGANNFSVDGTFIAVGLRGLGLNLGIRF